MSEALEEVKLNEEVFSGRTDSGISYQRSAAFAQMAAALAKAQLEMKPAPKDSVNPHFSTKYADLASVIGACQEPLAKHGIARLQVPTVDGSKVTVTTLLFHSSGEWISFSLALPMEKITAQGAGIAISYGRRYGLSSITGVAAEDEDGNGISGIDGKQSQQRRQAPQQQHKREADEDRREDLGRVKEALGETAPKTPNPPELQMFLDKIVKSDVPGCVATINELIADITEAHGEPGKFACAAVLLNHKAKDASELPTKRRQYAEVLCELYAKKLLLNESAKQAVAA